MSILENRIDGKLFSNACEGTTQLKTQQFKPTGVLKDFVKLMNLLYYGEDPLFEINELPDETVLLVAGTYLLRTDWEADIPDLDSVSVPFPMKEYIEWKKKLGEDLNGLRPKYGDAVDVVKLILSDDYNGDLNSISLGDFLDPLIAPDQKVLVQITDLKYGNSEFTIET